ncbi:MAG: hypothetical protein IMZ50_15560 [Candidatus Atribacteria bacterium]|nr:hypothetical protein [Candidatus Atribacteria bacterium]
MGITTAQAFPSKWLSKHDVKTPIVATISRVVFEKLGTDNKPVVYFTEPHIKPMSVNVGNWRVLDNAYGDDSDLWIGKQIEIYADPYVQFQGETVGGLKLRLPAGSPPRYVPVAPPAPADVLTWEGAQAEAYAAGVGVDTLKAGLKARGLTSYNSKTGSPDYNADRVTAAVREIIAAQTGISAFDESGDTPTGDEIPF